MRTASIRRLAGCLALALCGAAAQAQTVEHTIARVPTDLLFGSLELRDGTAVRGLDDQGRYVGSFGERNSTVWGVPHGFIHGSDAPDWGAVPGTDGQRRLHALGGSQYPDPEYRYFDLMASATSAWNLQYSQPNDINDAGVVVGQLTGNAYGAEPSRAFQYDIHTNELVLLQVPGAVTATATGINNLGHIVGSFVDADNRNHGFLYRDGSYTVIDLPGHEGRTRLGGINDAGTIVGYTVDPAHIASFIYRAGHFETFSVQGVHTYAFDINNAEQIVGALGVTGQRRGFYWEAGTGVVLDLSAGSGSTYAYTINNLGVIGGSVGSVGFLATVTPVPEPATLALWFAGLAGVSATVARRRRAAIRV